MRFRPAGTNASCSAMRAASPCACRHTLKGFVRDERGSVTIFCLVLFVLVLLTTGVAIDLLRQESERAELQDALDRGVLAAAAIDQVRAAKETVEQYVARRSYSGEAATTLVERKRQPGSVSQVNAIAEYDIDTVFLRLAGLSKLPVKAAASAMEGLESVEISLVLDISGSMSREDTQTTDADGNPVTRKRLDVLKTAATRFVDEVLPDEQAKKTTSISLVPFAGHVNALPFFDTLVATRDHANSSCVEFEFEDDPNFWDDFKTTHLPGPQARTQVPHFQYFRFEGDHGHEADWGWCPSDAQAIVPITNDADVLKARIAGFRAHDGTGSQIGMKWGLALLDGDNRWALEALPAGTVPDRFADRPRDFGTDRTMKVIVLMTDGNLRFQQRPASGDREWKLETTYEQETDEALRTGELTELCGLAKHNDVIVFTIGFDIDEASDAYGEMKNCASTEGHFHHVNGLDLEKAFEEIADTIHKLRLIG